MKLKCYNIVWDLDGVEYPEDVDLPKEVTITVEDDYNPSVEPADTLSDEYGFCIKSLLTKPVMSEWVVRTNCEYSFSVEANTEEEAIEEAQKIDYDDWMQAWSPIEVEQEE